MLEESSSQLEGSFWQAIHRCIYGLVKKFEESPYFFYKESDAKCYLYHLLISEEQFQKHYRTKDDKDTWLVHTEHPSSGNLPIDLVVLNPLKFDKRGFRKQRIACAFELKVWDSAGYNAKREREIREIIVEKGRSSFVIYLARGGHGGWEYFRSKFNEFKTANEEVFLESTKVMALVTRIRPEGE